MNIEEIPSDSLVVMTDFWHKAFNAYGCNPCCHSCGKMLKVGNEFKLGTIPKREETNTNYPESLKAAIDSYKTSTEMIDVMLCDKCSPKMYIKKDIDHLKRRIDLFKDQPSKQGCFRVKGVIVH